MTHIIKTLLLTLAVPTVSWVLLFFIQRGMVTDVEMRLAESFEQQTGQSLQSTPELRAKLTIDNLCAEATTPNSGKANFCHQLTELKMMKWLCLVTIALTILILFGIRIAGVACRKNRDLLLVVFKPGLRLTQVTIALLALLNGAVGIYAIYRAETYWVHRIHLGLMLGMGIGALVVVWGIAKSIFQPLHATHPKVMGKKVAKTASPRLWKLVEETSQKLGTAPPEHIVAGIDANFFVTETDVTCLDGELQGRTLYVSLPLSRILSEAELQAIVGHELGHFMGEDTKFAQRFFPIYRGAIETYSAAQGGGEAGNAGLISSMASLMIASFFFDAFAIAEKEISRDREFAADGVGASVTTKETAALSLAKVYAYSTAWEHSYNEWWKEVQEKRSVANFCDNFSAKIASAPFSQWTEGIDTRLTAHPTDSHPPLPLRLEQLGFSLAQTLPLAEKLPTNPASNLFENATALEAEVTAQEELVITAQVDAYRAYQKALQTIEESTKKKKS